MVSSYDKLIDLLNKDNPYAVRFDSTNIVFSDPIPDDGDSWNTKLTISAVPGSGFIGSVDVTYHRIPLSDIGEGNWLFSDEEFTIDTIVSILNTAKETFLLATDMNTIAIPDMRVGDIETVVLSAHSKSLGWIGSVGVTITLGFPGIAEKLNLLVNNTLPGDGYLT